MAEQCSCALYTNGKNWALLPQNLSFTSPEPYDVPSPTALLSRSALIASTAAGAPQKVDSPRRPDLQNVQNIGKETARTQGHPEIQGNAWQGGQFEFNYVDSASRLAHPTEWSWNPRPIDEQVKKPKQKCKASKTDRDRYKTFVAHMMQCVQLDPSVDLHVICTPLPNFVARNENLLGKLMRRLQRYQQQQQQQKQQHTECLIVESSIE